MCWKKICAKGKLDVLKYLVDENYNIECVGFETECFIDYIKYTKSDHSEPETDKLYEELQDDPNDPADYWEEYKIIRIKDVMILWKRYVKQQLIT